MHRRDAIIALMVLTAVSIPAGTQPRADEVVVILPAPEGRGCYYDQRGNMFCGRYCYWEVNGKRYCHEHARHAYAKGVVYTEPYRPYRRALRHHRRQSPHHTIK